MIELERLIQAVTDDGARPRWLALIGDIVGSRQLANRGEVQRNLREVLERLNRRSLPLSPYTITLGDEFQAVHGRAEAVFCDACRVWAALAPVRVRFAIGVGTLSTPINRQAALGMDGPAFYRARDGIERLKHSGYLLDVFLPDDARIPLLHNSLHIFSETCQRWRRSRFEVLARLYEGAPVSQIAAELGMSEQAVYKNIDYGDLRLWLAVFEETVALLDDVVEGR